MSFDLDDRFTTHAPPRAPVRRRPGPIGALLAAIGNWTARSWRDRPRRRHRRAPPVPDWLREDIGLPPVTPRPLPNWWDVRW